jgi:hypothetical protein
LRAVQDGRFSSSASRSRISRSIVFLLTVENHTIAVGLNPGFVVTRY